MKDKITWRKPNVVARDQVKISVELMKLHTEVFLTCNIFFVNKIPVFRALIQKIYLTFFNHLMNSIILEIYKAFKEVYI